MCPNYAVLRLSSPLTLYKQVLNLMAWQRWHKSDWHSLLHTTSLWQLATCRQCRCHCCQHTYTADACWQSAVATSLVVLPAVSSSSSRLPWTAESPPQRWSPLPRPMSSQPATTTATLIVGGATKLLSTGSVHITQLFDQFQINQINPRLEFCWVEDQRTLHDQSILFKINTQLAINV